MTMYAEERVRRLFDEDGLSEQEIHDLVNRVATNIHANGVNGHVAEPPIYAPDDVPDGLVTLSDAEQIFGLRRGRIRTWIARGHISERGRERGSAPGGGRILVDLSDVERLVTTPPRPGPRQSAITA